MNDLAIIPAQDVGELDRSTYLGSSDISAILGLSPWATPVDVYFAKFGMPKPVDADKQRLFNRGKRMEKVILDMLEEERGIEFIAKGARYRDPKHPWMAAEIDAEAIIDGEHVNIECKSVHPMAAYKFGEEGTDEIDIGYAAQATFGQMVTGRRRTMFAVLVGADNLSVYWLDRDDETVVAIRQKAIDFWHNHVLARVPPEPILIEDVYRLMRRDVDIVAEAPKDIVDLIGKFNQAKQLARSATEQADELKFQIGKWLLGEDTMTMPTKKPKHVIVSGGEPLLTVAYQEQNRVDSDALRKRHPEIAAECSKTSQFYRFDTPKKGNRK